MEISRNDELKGRTHRLTLVTTRNADLLRRSACSANPVDRLLVAINPYTPREQILALQRGPVAFVRDAAGQHIGALDSNFVRRLKVQKALESISKSAVSEHRPVLKSVMERDCIPSLSSLLEDLDRLMAFGSEIKRLRRTGG